MGRENESEAAKQRRILADRERKRLARSYETPEMKEKRNEADKIRKRLMRGMEAPEAKRRRREAEKQRRLAAKPIGQPSPETVTTTAPTSTNQCDGEVIICGIPLSQGGYIYEGKEVVPPEVPVMSMKQFPSTIQKLPLLLREEMKPYERPLTNAPHQYGINL